MTLQGKIYNFGDASPAAHLRSIADALEERAFIAHDPQTEELGEFCRRIAQALECAGGLYIVALRHEARWWHYSVHLPSGGRESAYCVPNSTRGTCLAQALRLVPPGSRYIVLIDGEPEGEFRAPEQTL